MQAYVDPLNRCFFNKSVLAVFFFFLHAQKSQQKGTCVAFVCRCVEKQFSLLNLSLTANKD